MAAELTDKLAFLRAHTRQDDATVLADAVRAGIDALYREALIEAYLLGETPRERLVEELGAQAADDVDYQRDALRSDVAWGLRGERAT
jgi:hypothetical protein